MQFCFSAVQAYTPPGVRQICLVLPRFFSEAAGKFSTREGPAVENLFCFSGEAGLSGLSKRQALSAPPVPSFLSILIFFDWRFYP